MSPRALDIAITGVGVIAPLGHDPATLHAALLAGRSAVAPLTRFDSGPLPCSVAATVSDFRARDHITNRKSLRLMTPAVQYGLGALRLAHRDAGLEATPLDPERAGMFVGSGTALGDTSDLVPAIEAGFTSGSFDVSAFGRDGMHLVNPLWLLKGLSNNVLGFGSADLDARGINQNYCNSAVGGLQAIGEAAWAIAEGAAEVIYAGAADSAVDPGHMTGFSRLRMLTTRTGPDAVRPFHAERDGFAPGEGAAFFALESAAHAQARGARVYARIVGYGSACAAHALPQGDPSAIVSAGRRAIEMAGWAPIDVDLIYAHGNATVVFDRHEAAAIYEIFGANTPVTSNKGQLGHAIAASGPLSLVSAISSARSGLIPPIMADHRADPDCAPIDLVTGQPRAGTLRRGLVQAGGLGGQTVALALEFSP